MVSAMSIVQPSLHADAFLAVMLKNLEDRLNAESRGIKDLNKDNNVYVSSVIMLLTTMKDICEVRPLFSPPPA